MAKASGLHRLAARDLLLGLLHRQLEEAIQQASEGQALERMAEVAALCMTAGRLATVIDLLGTASNQNG